MPASSGKEKIPYDSAQPDMRLLRLALFERLRREPEWGSMPRDPGGFDPYIHHVHPDRAKVLVFDIRKVMWQLFIEGILAPGSDSNNLDLPWFHLTQLGKAVLEAQGPNPFDPEGYIDFVKRRVPSPDNTVLAYLSESLNTQRHGSLTASAVMLGIAAERVFLLVCESLRLALTDPRERGQFETLLKRFPMKPKVEWVRNKLEKVQASRPPEFPENAMLMVVAMYGLIRHQRNELGHPREDPPALPRDDVLFNLQVFIRYYETAEALRRFLAKGKV